MPTPAAKLIINTGTYFGECVGYCIEELRMTPEKIVYSKKSSVESEELPDIVRETAMSNEVWIELVASVDLDVFKSLPDTIGLPDHADQGGEWVEISDGISTKRIDFEYGASIPEIDSLVRRLRDLRQSISSKHSNCVLNHRP